MEKSKRNSTIDLVRVVAAFGVVAIHVASSTPAAEGIGKFFLPLCVPFFYVVSLTYFFYSLSSASLSKTTVKIWWRILVPYLAWTIIYIGLLATKNILTGGHKTFAFWRVLFYGESAVQLYFMPELIIMQMLMFTIYLLINVTGKNMLAALLLGLGTIYYLQTGYSNNCFGVTKPVSIISYILSAFWISSILKKSKTSSIYGYVIIGCMLVTVSLAWQFSSTLMNVFPVVALMPIGGVGLILISINAPIQKLPKWVSILTTTTLGIYLTHVLFLEAFEYMAPKLWKAGAYYNVPFKLGVVTIIFIFSASFTILLQRNHLTRMLFLGYRN